MSDPDPNAGGSRTTLHSGKLTEQHPVIKEKPYLQKSAQPSNRSKTILWLIGEPARDTMPKVPVCEISKQTCDVITVYWRMAKIPVLELSDTKKKTYCAAYRLSQLWQEY